MKNVLKSSLALVAVAALAACGGGGGSEDAADKYVGSWKSLCFQNTTNAAEYLISTYNLAKVSAGEVTNTGTFTGYSNAQCTVSTRSGNITPHKMNIGTETTFLGLKAENVVYTNLATGAALPGYATVADGKWYLRTYAPNTTPTVWGRAFPATRQ